jgi:hypothetical protein
VTSGAAAALQQNGTAMISIANRVIAIGYITMFLSCGEQKRQNHGRLADSYEARFKKVNEITTRLGNDIIKKD